MKDLIYYPRFESNDENWLKFALLYMENFIPIIPANGRVFLSANYQKLIDETDLVQPYEPKYKQGERATLKAIKDVEEILSDTYKNSVLFDTVNLKRTMQNPINWGDTLFQDKYTYDWEYFCLQNSLGKQSDFGLQISSELAMIYMTSLAQEIAFEEDSSTITDLKQWDNYTTFKRAKSPDFLNKAKLAETVINIKLPQNLREIDFDKIIAFRNSNRKFLTAFGTNLNNMYDYIGKGLTSHQFISEHQKIFSEYTKEVLALGLRVSAIPLGVWILIDNSQSLGIQYAKEILGGLGVTIGGAYALKKVYKNLEDKRFSKKYLSNLENLK